MSSVGGVWSQAPDDILALVGKRLSILSDMIRFCTVCRRWRKVSLERGFSPSILPSLVLPSFCFKSPAHAYHFYYPFSNLSLKEIHALDKDQWAMKYGGSPDGWLLEQRRLVDDFDNVSNLVIDLVNPLLQRRIRMPLLPYDPCHYMYIHKAALSCGQPRGGNDMAVMVITCSSQALLARPGDEQWRQASLRRYDCYILNVIYHKRQFHAITDDGKLVVFKECKDGESGGLDLSFIVKHPIQHPCPRNSSSAPGVIHYFLAESSRGELRLVVMHHLLDTAPTEDEAYKFQVFKLEDENQVPTLWSEVESLGKDAIFLSNDLSLSVSTASSSSSGCKENCIYFLTGRFRETRRNCINVYSMDRRRIIHNYPLDELLGHKMFDYWGVRHCHWAWERKI